MVKVSLNIPDDLYEQLASLSDFYKQDVKQTIASILKAVCTEQDKITFLTKEYGVVPLDLERTMLEMFWESFYSTSLFNKIPETLGVKGQFTLGDFDFDLDENYFMFLYSATSDDLYVYSFDLTKEGSLTSLTTNSGIYVNKTSQQSLDKLKEVVKDIEEPEEYSLSSQCFPVEFQDGIDMPVELEFEMYSEKEILLPPFTGYVARGLLLNMLRHVDAGVSQEMHEPQVMKPYSVTPLYFRSKERRPEGYVIDPAYPCRLRARFLEDELAKTAMDYFKDKNTISVYDTTLTIAALNMKSDGYEKLLNEAKPVEEFTLIFKTPTYLSEMGATYNCLFPQPERVFPNLMRLWNLHTTTKKYSKEEFQEYKEWEKRNIGVTAYQLKTTLAQMGKKKATGFMGWTTYSIKSNDEWNKLTCTLAKLAEYSNIGGNRTGGFGVTRLLGCCHIAQNTPT